MYLLDTHVVSELKKAKTGKIDHNVNTWASRVSASSLFLSSISILELEMGILGKERQDPIQGKILRDWLEKQVLPAFAERILSIDTQIARRCTQLHVPNRRPDRDALIAATALVHGMVVVTRNINDFVTTKVELLNPWEAQ